MAHMVGSSFKSFVLAAQLCPALRDPWTVVRQAPLSVGFPSQKYWSGFPFPPPGDLLNRGIKPRFLASPALPGGLFTAAPPGKPKIDTYSDICMVTLTYGKITVKAA